MRIPDSLMNVATLPGQHGDLTRRAFQLMEAGLDSGRWLNRHNERLWPTEFTPADVPAIIGFPTVIELAHSTDNLHNVQTILEAPRFLLTSQQMEAAFDLDPLPDPWPHEPVLLVLPGVLPTEGPPLTVWTAVLLTNNPERSLWLGFTLEEDEDPALSFMPGWFFVENQGEWPLGAALASILTAASWDATPALSKHGRKRTVRALRKQALADGSVDMTGGLVRVIRAHTPTQATGDGSDERAGRHVAPHLRRPHFHRYRVGSNILDEAAEGETWRYELRWIEETTVGGMPPDDGRLIVRMLPKGLTGRQPT